MRLRLTRNIRLILLPLIWLLSVGVGPIEEGVEVGVDAGGGEYENNFGCGPRQRYRYAASHAFVKYRPNSSSLTVSAEAAALTSRTIAREIDGAASQGTIENVNEIGPERLSAAGRIGGQWKYLGLEVGGGWWGDNTHSQGFPTASARFHPLPRHSLDVTLFDLPTHVHPALWSLAYSYGGDQFRYAIGLRPGQENDVWGEVGYRLTERHSLGVELHYFAGGYLGEMGAAFLQYRWHTTTPRPASWSSTSAVEGSE